jgi:hypothetical protein
MKIKLYINTYDANNILNDYCLKSLFESDFDQDGTIINVVDNHSNVFIKEEYREKVKVIHNQLRPDFSTGHLARSWNLCLINGFIDLDNPDCDIVILCQVDSFFNKEWFLNVLKLKNTYKLDYATSGSGDQFQYFTPEAIKNIGLYDERFCNIGYQEADYFLRAAKYHPDKTSINDAGHGRIFNNLNLIFLDTEKLETGCTRGEPSHVESRKYHSVSSNMFYHKWDVSPQDWLSNTICNASLKTNNYILYPYFENKILKETLIKQNYIIP